MTRPRQPGPIRDDGDRDSRRCPVGSTCRRSSSARGSKPSFRGSRRRPPGGARRADPRSLVPPLYVRRNRSTSRPGRRNLPRLSSMPSLAASVRELYEAYHLFLAAFRDAADRLRAGDRTARFPRGSFPPALPFVSALAPLGAPG
jgi:hypothetical protein